MSSIVRTPASVQDSNSDIPMSSISGSRAIHLFDKAQSHPSLIVTPASPISSVHLHSPIPGLFLIPPVDVVPGIPSAVLDHPLPVNLRNPTINVSCFSDALQGADLLPAATDTLPLSKLKAVDLFSDSVSRLDAPAMVALGSDKLAVPASLYSIPVKRKAVDLFAAFEPGPSVLPQVLNPASPIIPSPAYLASSPFPNSAPFQCRGIDLFTAGRPLPFAPAPVVPDIPKICPRFPHSVIPAVNCTSFDLLRTTPSQLRGIDLFAPGNSAVARPIRPIPRRRKHFVQFPEEAMSMDLGGDNERQDEEVLSDNNRFNTNTRPPAHEVLDLTGSGADAPMKPDCLSADTKPLAQEVLDLTRSDSDDSMDPARLSAFMADTRPLAEEEFDSDDSIDPARLSAPRWISDTPYSGSHFNTSPEFVSF